MEGSGGEGREGEGRGRKGKKIRESSRGEGRIRRRGRAVSLQKLYLNVLLCALAQAAP